MKKSSIVNYIKLHAVPFKIIAIIIASIAFIFLVDGRKIIDFPRLQSAGLKTLTPIDVKTDKTTSKTKGRPTTTSYTQQVKFSVDIEGKKYNFWMKTSEAYGENDAEIGVAAVKKKKTIKRYVFYTDDLQIYCSKNAKTVKEFINEEVGSIINYVLMIDMILILPMILWRVIGNTGLPDIFMNGEEISKEKMIACKYDSYTFSLLMMFCFVLTFMSSIELFQYIKSANFKMDVFIMELFLTSFFLTLGIIVFLFIRNYAIIFFPGGIAQRTLFGKTRIYGEREIKGYIELKSYKNHELFIMLEGKKKKLSLDHFASNFKNALLFVKENYVSLK